MDLTSIYSVLFVSLLVSAIFFMLGTLFELIMTSYALRSKAALYNFMTKNSIKESNEPAFAMMIRKCGHLEQSAGNWTVPIVVMMKALLDQKDEQSNFFDILNENISLCDDKIVKNFLQRRSKSLAKYLMIYLFFGSPILPFLFTLLFCLLYFYPTTAGMVVVAALVFVALYVYAKLFAKLLKKSSRMDNLNVLAQVIEKQNDNTGETQCN